MQGNIGKGIVKVSSVEKYWKIKAPALVFNNQTEFIMLTKMALFIKTVLGGAGTGSKIKWDRITFLFNFIVLQNLGYKIALRNKTGECQVRLVLFYQLHIYPEAAENGLISQIKDLDITRLM